MLKLVKLVTGEEVLAKVETTPQNGLILENPVRLQLSQKGVAMIPLSPFMKEGAKITITERDIMFIVDADEDVVNGYNQQFGGIVVAPPGLTLG
jgi:hypothetical protein